MVEDKDGDSEEIIYAKEINKMVDLHEKYINKGEEELWVSG